MYKNNEHITDVNVFENFLSSLDEISVTVCGVLYFYTYNFPNKIKLLIKL